MMAWYKAPCGCRVLMMWRGRIDFADLPLEQQIAITTEATTEHVTSCPNRQKPPTPPQEPA